MAEQSKIEWCDATFNPWWGCERVSPACAHCYADTFARRIGMPDLWAEKDHRVEHGFRFFGDAHWDEPLKWARKLPAKLGRRPRVFCASMADVFEERPELDEPRRRLFDLIAETPELDWLILTKRPEFARDLFAAWDRHDDELNGPDFKLWPLPNVWLGVSIENARFTWRANVLREIPAAVRFISAEPLLGSLYDGSRDVQQRGAAHLPVLQGDGGRDPEVVGDRRLPDGHRRRRRAGASGSPAEAPSGSDQVAQEVPRGHARRAPLDLTGIDWVIVGGESGPGARPFHLEHAREIIDAAVEHSDHVYEGGGVTAVFVKQLGAKPIDGASHSVEDPRAGSWAWTLPLSLRDRKGGDMSEWPADLRIREFPRSAVPA